jgi:hypothetical protein
MSDLDVVKLVKQKIPSLSKLSDKDVATKIVAERPDLRYRVVKYLADPEEVKSFRMGYFNTKNPNANIPRQLAQRLALNPTDRQAIEQLKRFTSLPAMAATEEYSKELRQRLSDKPGTKVLPTSAGVVVVVTVLCLLAYRLDLLHAGRTRRPSSLPAVEQVQNLAAGEGSGREAQNRPYGEASIVKRQLTALWVGVVLFVLSFCVPPWHSSGEYEGFHFLFTEHGWHGRIDVYMLLCEWLVIAVVTGASVFSLRRSQD